MDGGGGVVGGAMGSAKPRVQIKRAIEEAGSAARHAGAPVPTGVGRVDRTVGRVSRPFPSVPHFHRAGGDVAVGSVRVPAAICPRPSSDGLAAGVAAVIREPEAFADRTGTEREAGFTGQLGGGSGTRHQQSLLRSALMALLQESRRSYESQKRLQTELVQKEKLASLGNLVAGAAHDINHPLTAVIIYSEQLGAKERLTDEQNALVRKIVNQAGRTRDLVADLLSFAQQSPAEKISVDVSVLLHRAKQMLESRRPSGKIRVGLSIDADFPRRSEERRVGKEC